MGACFVKSKALVPEEKESAAPLERRVILLCPPGLPQAHKGFTNPAQSLMGMLLTDSGRTQSLSPSKICSKSSDDETFLCVKESVGEVPGLHLYLRCVGASRDLWKQHIHEKGNSNWVVFVVDRTIDKKISSLERSEERKKEEGHFAALASLLVEPDTDLKFADNLWGGKYAKEGLKIEYFADLADLVMSHSAARLNNTKQQSTVEQQQQEYFDALIALDLPLLAADVDRADEEVVAKKKGGLRGSPKAPKILKKQPPPTRANIVVAELFSSLTAEQSVVDSGNIGIVSSPRSSLRAHHVHVAINVQSGEGIRDFISLLSQTK